MLLVVYLAIVLHIVSGAFWRVPTKAPSNAIEQPTNEPTISTKNGPRLYIFTHCNINIIVPRNLSQESVIKLDLVVRQSLSDSTGIALSDISVQKHAFSELKSYTRRLQWRTPTKSPSLLQKPSISPSQVPTPNPSQWSAPSQSPSQSLAPSILPSLSPQNNSIQPSQIPTPTPSIVVAPSDPPSVSPLQWRAPTQSPSLSFNPSLSPQITNPPTIPAPTQQPSIRPTLPTPTQERFPTQVPTTAPSDPSQEPSQEPTLNGGGVSTHANVMETIYLTIQNRGPFDTTTLNATAVTSIITHINDLIHQAAMDGSLSTALVTNIQSSGNNEINNPTTIASASTINQVTFYATSTSSPSTLTLT